MFQVHLWTGLIVGLYIVAIGCTDLAGYCRARARATADFSA